MPRLAPRHCRVLACIALASLALAGCSGRTTLEKVAVGGALGAAGAAVLGGSLGVGATLGVAGGLLFGNYVPG